MPTTHAPSTAVPTNTLPPLNSVLHIARAAACRIAHRPDDVDDLIQIGLIAYNNDLPRHTDVRKPWALARTILQRAMVLYYYTYRHDTGKWSAIQTRSDWKRSVSIDEMEFTSNLNGSAGESQAELFELEDYYNALERECGKTARVMVENLVSPNNPCIMGYILSESQDKIATRKNSKATSVADRRRLPRGGGAHHPIRISQSIIREAMGLQPWEWGREMKRIREFTTKWFAEEGLRPVAELLA